MDKLEKGEIVYCDITYQYERPFRKIQKVETIKLNKVVFGREYVSDYPLLDYNTYKRDIRKINKKKPLDCDVKVVDLQVHSRVGFKNRTNKYTEVKKNIEQRNKTTGAYE